MKISLEKFLAFSSVSTTQKSINKRITKIAG